MLFFHSKRLAAALICGAVALFVCNAPRAVWAQVKATSAPVEKFALIVGITDYNKNEIFAPLEGPVKDAEAMKAALVRNYGFKNDAAHILVLTNAKATRRDVVNAFRSQLTANAKLHPNGVFVFYFSGHGSTVRDANGDEKLADAFDFEDETLVTFDATRDPADREHFDLVDDDTDLLISELRGISGLSGNLTTIFDSCHSGTATRAPSDGTRRVKEIAGDKRDYPMLPIRDKGAQGGTYTHFSGCMATETSQEAPLPVKVGAKEINQPRGVLTYYLTQAMDEATRTTNNGDIWARVSRSLARYAQNPQIEGELNRPFLGGANRDTVPEIRYTRQGAKLIIESGVESGALEGGFVAINAAGQTKGAAATPLRLKITKAALERSEVTLPADAKVSDKGTVRLLTPFFGSEPLQVSLSQNLNADDPVVKRLREAYKSGKDDFVRLAAPLEGGDVTLVKTTFGVAFPNRNDVAADGEGYVVMQAAGGEPLFRTWVATSNPDGDISAAGELKLRAILEAFAAQRNVRALSNKSEGRSNLGGLVKYSLIKSQGATDDTNRWKKLVTSKDQTLSNDATRTYDFRMDEGVEFQIENLSSEKLYVSMLWLGGDGSITPLQDKNTRQAMVLTPKGKAGSKAKTASYGIAPPAGAETIKLLVSRQPINVAYLQRDAVEKGDAVIKRDATRKGKGGAAQEKGSVSPLDRLTDQAVGVRSPNLASEDSQISFDGWASDELRIRIEGNS